MRFTQAIQKVIDLNPNQGSKLQQAEKLAQKWQKLGLMEGLSDKTSGMRANVAIMLQNQGKQILREANATGNGQFHEEWVGIAMPLVRRFMHKLVAKDFVTIQAMSQPTGLVFFIDHQFGSDRKGFKKGESIYGTTFKNGVSGDASYVMDTNIETGLYGAGAWGYSLNDKIANIGSASIADGDKVQLTTPVVASSNSVFTADEFNYDTRFINAYSGSTGWLPGLQKLTVAYPSTIQKNGIDAFNLDIKKRSGGVGEYVYATSDHRIGRVFKEYTKINGSNLEFYVLIQKNHAADGATPDWNVVSSSTELDAIVTGSTLADNYFTQLSYHVQPEAHNRGDFEYRGDDLQEDDLGIPEVQFNLSQKPIVPKTRKMKATWTQELIDDLNSLLAIDGEQEISNQLTDQITLETDLQLIAMIGKGAMNSGNRGYFSAKVGTDVESINESTGIVTFGENTKYMITGKADWYKNINVPMQKVSNMIHQKTGKGGANFAIVSPTVATLFESMEGFSVNTDGTQDEFDGGLSTVGSFKSRYKIYKNPYSVSDNTVIMGYRGTGFLDFGAAYCPYIPLIMTPNILEPTNLTPTKGVYTRYAKTMLRQDYYGALLIHGLDTV